MKKINNILIVTLFLTGVSTISAHADENQATYAVVNSAGVVTNIIVCGPAVCGPNGSWGGIMPSDTPWAGQQLVLQVPVHTETGKSLGGYLGTPENPVKYDSQAQVFTQGSASTPISVTRSEIVDTTTLVAEINSNTVTFGPNSVVDNQMQFTPVVDETTSARITATQLSGETRTVTRVITNSVGETSTVTSIEFVPIVESILFATPQTVEQIRASLTNDLAMLRANLNRLIALLKDWVKN
jgi:hypothetical protein